MGIGGSRGGACGQNEGAEGEHVGKMRISVPLANPASPNTACIWIRKVNLRQAGELIRPRGEASGFDQSEI